MQSIGVLLKNGGRRPPMATFSHKGRRKQVCACVVSTKQKWPGLLPAISCRERFASARPRDARGRGRQRCRAAVAQRRYAADDDEPDFTALSAGLLPSIVRPLNPQPQDF